MRSVKVFFRGHTVTFGNFNSDIGFVSIVVLIGLSDQLTNESLINKVAIVNPVATTRIQKNLVISLVDAMWAGP